MGIRQYLGTIGLLAAGLGLSACATTQLEQDRYFATQERIDLVTAREAMAYEGNLNIGRNISDITLNEDPAYSHTRNLEMQIAGITMLNTHLDQPKKTVGNLLPLIKYIKDSNLNAQTKQILIGNAAEKLYQAYDRIADAMLGDLRQTISTDDWYKSIEEKMEAFRHETINASFAMSFVVNAEKVEGQPSVVDPYNSWKIIEKFAFGLMMSDAWYKKAELVDKMENEEISKRGFQESFATLHKYVEILEKMHKLNDRIKHTCDKEGYYEYSESHKIMHKDYLFKVEKFLTKPEAALLAAELEVKLNAYTMHKLSIVENAECENIR